MPSIVIPPIGGRFKQERYAKYRSVVQREPELEA